MDSIGSFLVWFLIIMACVTQCNHVENKTEEKSKCSTIIVPVGKTMAPITNCEPKGESK